MANTIKLKRSANPNTPPTTAQLELGEVAINTYDGKMYIKKDDGVESIVEVGGSASADLLNVTTGIASPDYIQFDTTATNTLAVGKLFWDAGEGSLLYALGGGNVTQNLHPGTELVYNGTGATLTKGQVVYLSGAQGQRPSVALAIATSDATSARTLGIVAETIANGAEGWVKTYGILEGFDTSAFTEGSQLYLSGTTAGAMTATKPSAPIHLVYTAKVIKSHATAGRILVGIQNGYELDEIHDVAISSPSTGQTIVYNSTTSLWSNGTLPVSGGGTGATSLTSGYVLKGNGTSAVSSSVIYDNGTNVGIGTSSPASKLHLSDTGPCELIIEADTDNVTETDNSRIIFKQDGGAVVSRVGYANGSNSFEVINEYADNLYLGTSNSTDLTINSAGNVGIGTTSPSRTLSVYDATIPVIALQNSTTGQTTGDGFQLYALGATAYIDQKENGSLNFLTNATERMRITSAGLVGVGTTAPAQLLHVQSASGAAGSAVARLAASGSTGLEVGQEFFSTTTDNLTALRSGRIYSKFDGTSYVDARLSFQSMTSGNTLVDTMHLKNGNVGIGTTTPGRLLELSSSAPTQRFTDTTAGDYSEISYNAGAFNINVDAGATLASSSFRVFVDNSERMRITSAGYVGIGTTSPLGLLEVANETAADNQDTQVFFTTQGTGSGSDVILNLVCENTTTGETFINFGDSAATDAGQLRYNHDGDSMEFRTNATERMRIDSSGNVGVGLAAPTTKLHVNGDVRAENGRFLATRGDAAAPAYRFHDDGDTGMFNLASNILGFSTGGSERMRIDASGNLGLGTTAPRNAGAGYQGITLDGSTSGFLDLNTNGTRVFTLYGQSNAIRFANPTATGVMAFDTNGTERMRITSAGDVGIGTSSPSARLDVVGTARAGNFRVNGGGSVTGAGMWGVDSALAFNVSSTERMRIDSAGRVGIGTATPDGNGNLTIAATSGAAGFTIQRTNTGVGGAQGFVGFKSVNGNFTSAINNLTSGDDDTAALIFRTATTSAATSPYNVPERMRIDSAGRVGIGIATPAQELHVHSTSGNADVRLTGDNQTAVYMDVYSGTASSGLWCVGSTDLRFGTNSAERVRITSAGNVGIGTTTPSSKLHVVGDINLDGISVRDTATTTTTATTQVALATFAGATYDSAEVVIKAKQGTAVHITKLLIVSDGTTASSTEFGTVLTGSSLFTTDVDISAGSIRVLITPTSATSTVFKTSYELITA